MNIFGAQPKHLTCILVALLLSACGSDSSQEQVSSGGESDIPRLANGVPNLNGIYGAVAPTEVPNPFAAGNVAATPLRSRNNDLYSFEADFTVQHRGEIHRPMYRPEFWEQVRELDLAGNRLDSAFNCLPEGVPRMGPPQKIVQTEEEMVFLYHSGNQFRTIPTDGRPRNEFLTYEQNWKGYSLGHWEEDKLVIETIGFTDRTWLGSSGWFHTEDLRVVEEMWWQDGKLMWKATAYDPDVLLEPFTFGPRALTPNADPHADLLPDFPCEERDLEVFEKVAPTIRG